MLVIVTSHFADPRSLFDLNGIRGLIFDNLVELLANAPFARDEACRCHGLAEGYKLRQDHGIDGWILCGQFDSDPASDRTLAFRHTPSKEASVEDSARLAVTAELVEGGI